MNDITRRGLLVGTAAVTAAAALGQRAQAVPGPTAGSAAGSAAGSTAGAESGFAHASRSRVRGWARDTWTSLVAMTDERTGLTADNIGASVTHPERSGYTSPTNIGGFLWSTVVARELGLISRRAASERLERTLRTLLGLNHHKPSGMFYNWYDEADGAVLTSWPGSGDPVQPFLSSVDNGWLAAGLMVAKNSDARTAHLARALLRRMDFRAFYAPTLGIGQGGLLKGGFWDGDHPDTGQQGNFLGRGPDVWYTPNQYDTTVSETRITSYIAIALGQVPAKHYFATWRTFPGADDWAWQEQRPVGVTRKYLGIDVYEGAYTYRGMHIVPGWGGSMFEALMPNMFVPEERWAPRSWGVNHPLTVRAHREHGLQEAGYGSWGFSPASNPAGGYREYGVDLIGLNPDGYFSDQLAADPSKGTNVDIGYAGVREGKNPHPTFADGVVTPHALFLASHHEPRQAYRALVDLEDLAYGAGGFYDAVAMRSRTVAKRYLSLDQAMVLGSLGNVYGGGIVRRAFSTGLIERKIRPVIAMEQFGAGLV